MSKGKLFTKSGEPLTPAIFYILLAVAIKPRHGYDIMKSVESESSGKIKLGPGTLYGAIKRLFEEKLIKEAKSENARRRYYMITKKGREILSIELRRYEDAVSFAKRFEMFTKLNIQMVKSL